MEQAHNESGPDQAGTTAMTVDPVITWLEQIRDFMGTTPASKDMAQRAIDRLRPPAVDPWSIVGTLVDDLGTLRASAGGALVSDRRTSPVASADDAGYYGGYLVGESMMRRNAIAFSFLPQLLVAARENRQGRAILMQLADALQTPVPQTDPVIDRLDGTIRLSRLAHDFNYAGGRLQLERGEFHSVAELLNRIAEALLTGTVEAARTDIEAWLERKREARRGGTA